MAGKKQFNINSPKSAKFTLNGDGGKVIASLEWSSGFARQREQAFSKKQAFVDEQCIDRMTTVDIHPIRNKVLARSAKLNTTIGSGEVIQNTPYARRQYYEHKTKSYWFERMKNRHKDSILKGAQNIG